MNKKKRYLSIIVILSTLVILFVFLGSILCLSQFHLDFSQDYKDVKGYENIVFKDPQNKQCFRLCAWGLVKTEKPNEFVDHRYLLSSSEYQLLVENTDAENIWQVVSSPDGKYILYAEKINVGIGVTTDEEKVYYRVYSIDDDTSITIYSDYRQFLLVDWK